MTSEARAERRRTDRHVRAAVCELLKRGFHPVPVHAQSKKPSAGDDWPTLQITPENMDEYFDEDSNVGVKVGNGIGDVDKDCVEAILAGQIFLPPTDMRHGRLSARHGHDFYRVRAKLRSLKLIDPVDKKTLIELRADPAPQKQCKQTVVPPSIHEGTGELLEWEAFGEPAVVDDRELARAVCVTGATALIARHYPPVSIRHEFRLALAGYLIRGGVERELANRIMQVSAEIAGANVVDAAATLEDTAVSLGAGAPTTGRTRLVELWTPNGGAIIGKLDQWLGLNTSHSSDFERTEPLNVFDASLAGTPSFPVEVLPPVLHDAAVDIAERMGADLGMTAMFALGAAGLALDHRLAVQPKEHDETWVENPRLWLAAIADAGQKKTPTLAELIRPLRAVERRWALDDAPLHTRYEVDQRVHIRAMRKFVESGGHGEVPSTPVRPRRRRRLVDDITIEALADVLMDNPSGVGFAADELTAFFHGFDAYRNRGGRDRARYLESYNGGEKLIDRVSGGHRAVPNWSVAILGGIQPGPLMRFAGRLSDDGFLARFVVFYAQPATAGVDREPNRAALARYTETIERMMQLGPDSQPTFRLSDGARRARDMVASVARTVSLLATTPAGLRAHLAKWEAHFCRLAFVWHVTEAVSRGAGADGFVSERCGTAIAKLMTDFLLPHAATFYAAVAGEEHQQHAKWVAGFILARQLSAITARDIARAYNELRTRPHLIDDAMATLTLIGWVNAVDSPGRKPTRWSVNPLVHERFAVRAEAERRTREETRRQIAEAACVLGIRDAGEEIDAHG